MSSILSGLRVAPRLSGVVARNCSTVIVSTPPTVKISTAEKIFALFCIAGSILISPMYFVPRFKVYANKKS